LRWISSLSLRRSRGHKWRPIYVEDLLDASSDSKREMSSKVLADVVEALIGAAMVDGGIPKVLACLRVFLFEMLWKPLEVRQSFPYQRASDIELPTTLRPLEILIGYCFRKKSLLVEAMTHASCNTGSASLERFEFLEDAILDNIIVSEMYEQNLTHVQMHTLRTAMVNADFLAWIYMDWCIEQESSSLEEVPDESGKGETGIKVRKEKVKMPLWRFMRHASARLGVRTFRISLLHFDMSGVMRWSFPL
jgi:dsRNA-specific ribonuclease